MKFLVRYAEKNEMWRTRNALQDFEYPIFSISLFVSFVFSSVLVWPRVALFYCLILSVLFFILPVWAFAVTFLSVRAAWHRDLEEKAERVAREVMDS